MSTQPVKIPNVFFPNSPPPLSKEKAEAETVHSNIPLTSDDDEGFQDASDELPPDSPKKELKSSKIVNGSNAFTSSATTTITVGTTTTRTTDVPTTPRKTQETEVVFKTSYLYAGLFCTLGVVSMTYGSWPWLRPWVARCAHGIVSVVGLGSFSCLTQCMYQNEGKTWARVALMIAGVVELFFGMLCGAYGEASNIEAKAEDRAVDVSPTELTGSGTQTTGTLKVDKAADIVIGIINYAACCFINCVIQFIMHAAGYRTSLIKYNDKVLEHIDRFTKFIDVCRDTPLARHPTKKFLDDHGHTPRIFSMMLFLSQDVKIKQIMQAEADIKYVEFKRILGSFKPSSNLTDKEYEDLGDFFADIYAPSNSWFRRDSRLESRIKELRVQFVEEKDARNHLKNDIILAYQRLQEQKLASPAKKLSLNLVYRSPWSQSPLRYFIGSLGPTHEDPLEFLEKLTHWNIGPEFDHLRYRKEVIQGFAKLEDEEFAKFPSGKKNDLEMELAKKRNLDLQESDQPTEVKPLTSINSLAAIPLGLDKQIEAQLKDLENPPHIALLPDPKNTTTYKDKNRVVDLYYMNCDETKILPFTQPSLLFHVQRWGENGKKSDRIDMPAIVAFNQKKYKKEVIISHADSTYTAHILNAAGEWFAHDDIVTPSLEGATSDTSSICYLINYEEISEQPVQNSGDVLKGQIDKQNHHQDQERKN
jgi:hypothetical protein